MGNVKDFPAKRTPLTKIAERLVKLGPKVRTMVVMWRETDGELSAMCHANSDDLSADDLLVLQRLMGEVVDSVWSGTLDADPEG